MAVYNIPPIVKGDTFKGITFSVVINGSPASLNGVKMDLRLIPTGILAQRFIVGAGITLGAVGVFSIDKQVIDLPANTYDYDIETTLTDGTVSTYIEGTWQILQDVTHA